MKEHDIGGLPVVEGPKNKIIGNLSMRDIRHLLLKSELFSNFRYYLTILLIIILVLFDYFLVKNIFFS